MFENKCSSSGDPIVAATMTTAADKDDMVVVVSATLNKPSQLRVQILKTMVIGVVE